MVDAAIFGEGVRCQFSVVVEDDSCSLSDSRPNGCRVSRIVWGDEAYRS